MKSLQTVQLFESAVCYTTKSLKRTGGFTTLVLVFTSAWRATGTRLGQCCTDFTESFTTIVVSPKCPSPWKKSLYFSTRVSLEKGTGSVALLSWWTEFTSGVLSLIRSSCLHVSADSRGLQVSSTTWKFSRCLRPLYSTGRRHSPRGLIVAPPNSRSFTLVVLSFGSPSCMITETSSMLMTLHVDPMSSWHVSFVLWWEWREILQGRNGVP